MDKVRWIDMIDPVYTLCNLVGVDPDTNDITGISIYGQNLIVWYIDPDGVRKTKSRRYEL